MQIISNQMCSLCITLFMLHDYETTMLKKNFKKKHLFLDHPNLHAKNSSLICK